MSPDRGERGVRDCHRAPSRVPGHRVPEAPQDNHPAGGGH